jgi:hypothetical protein
MRSISWIGDEAGLLSFDLDPCTALEFDSVAGKALIIDANFNHHLRAVSKLNVEGASYQSPCSHKEGIN